MSPRAQLSSMGFARPIRLMFESVLRTGEDHAEITAGDRYAPRRMQVTAGASRVSDRPFAAPLVRLVLLASDQARRLQSGQLHLYLATLLVTLVALLIWGRG